MALWRDKPQGAPRVCQTCRSQAARSLAVNRECIDGCCCGDNQIVACSNSRVGQFTDGAAYVESPTAKRNAATAAVVEFQVVVVWQNAVGRVVHYLVEYQIERFGGRNEFEVNLLRFHCQAVAPDYARNGQRVRASGKTACFDCNFQWFSGIELRA